MRDEIEQAGYYYVIVLDKPGAAAKILIRFRQAGINLLAFTAFPKGGGQSQLDFVPEDGAAFERAAHSMELQISDRKTVFLIRGDKHPEAIDEHLINLARQGINVTSCQALASEPGRYAALLWVKPADQPEAADALTGKQVSDESGGDAVDIASEGSFPASDPPSWAAPTRS